MKNLFITLNILLVSMNSALSQNDGDHLFDDSFLHEIRFENADTNLFITTKDYQQLKVIIDGNIVDSIGFKRKGNISAYNDPNKLGIKIKTNKYVDNKKYDGIKEFTLHMNYTDPTMMREKLTYDLCADMGLYSLRTAFVKVYINNTYWGLYTIVEGKDEMYKQIFDHRDMDAIESLDFGDMCYLSNTPSEYDYENNTSGFPYYTLENGNPTTAWQNFSTMIDKANNTPDMQYMETVSEYLNLEDFFKYQAINVYLMNMDSYISFKGNQIYVYDTLAKIWQVTPWDFNASFGLWDTNNFNPSSYDMIPNAIANGCIASRLNNIPELKTYYLDAMCRLNNIIGDTTTYFSKIDSWKNQIQEAVYDDTRKHVSNTDFNYGINYGYNTLFGENQPSLKTFIAERLAVVRQGLINENYNCISTVENKEVNDFSSSISIYPNPTHDIVNIQINENNRTDYDVEIVNIFGQVIIHHNTQLVDINIEKLNPGLYFLNVKNGRKKYSTKFIKI